MPSSFPQGSPGLLLDVGCGSGLSGRVLEEEAGCLWIGTDISRSMLNVALDRDDIDYGDLIEVSPSSARYRQDGVVSLLYYCYENCVCCVCV